jgi:hypothetical protein
MTPHRRSIVIFIQCDATAAMTTGMGIDANNKNRPDHC